EGSFITGASKLLKKPAWEMLEESQVRRAASSPFDLPAASRKSAQAEGLKAPSFGPVLGRTLLGK
ncbi:MAG: hypothetical protein VST66_08800, partial [Nitrospirota bacterium]|nr:hypothetical protein [Nitrospirota bacterium]